MSRTQHLVARARPLALVLIVVVAAAVAPAVQAQAVRPLSFGISAGGAFLTGQNRDRWRDGFAAQGTASLGFPILPVQLRADLGYQTFPGKTVRITGTGGGFQDVPTAELTVWSGTLSVVARSSVGFGIVRPYVAAGGGIYRTEREGTAGQAGSQVTSTNGGLSAALGVTIPVAGLNAFFEGRVHNVFARGHGASHIRTFPLVAGFLF